MSSTVAAGSGQGRRAACGSWHRSSGTVRGSRAVLAGVCCVLGCLCLWAVVVPRVWAAGSCPNEEFRVGPSAALPDCRAYEMVSPPDKNGGEVDGGILFGELAAPEQAAADGGAVTYGSTSAFADAHSESALVVSQYISTRTPNGWVTRAITPTQELPGARLETLPGAPDWSLYQGFDEELNDGFLLAWNPQPDPSAPAGFFNPYLRDNATEAYRLLSSTTPPDHSPSETVLGLGGSGFRAVYAGMSGDGRHVIFEANDALTPEALPGKVNLYEWSAGRPLELVSAAGGEGGAAPQFGSNTHGPASLFTELGDGGAAGGFPWNFSGVLSSDGGRAFWTGGDGQVYMHELTEEGARTVDISASQKSGSSSGDARYWTANPSGSLVYFTSSAQLTADATAGAGEDLYEYDTETGALNDLTVDRNAGETAAVKGVLGMGESDGSAYVYFVAGGVLADNANSNGEKAAPQSCRSQTYENQTEPNTPCNLYVSHEGVTTYIATLAGAVEWEKSDYTEAVMVRTSRVSPNGSLLAFQSQMPLTGYDSAPAGGGQCPLPSKQNQREGATTGNLYRGGDTGDGGCAEVFEYNAQTKRLVCASCSPSGQSPTAYSLLPESFHVWGNVTGWQSSTDQQRYLLNDGRLFFQSEDALSPAATNGQQNIYEYEPEGVGQCGAADWNGGCLYLISTGSGGGYAYFVDASADGRDVFFLTGQQLVPQDGDEAIDVYDAREAGGFAVAVPAPCSGEACKPAIAPAPAIYGAPASATFEGPENSSPVSAPATKAKAKKHATVKHGQKKKQKKRKAGSASRTSAEKRLRNAGRTAAVRAGGGR
jgi:hypothetical protein